MRFQVHIWQVGKTTEFAPFPLLSLGMGYKVIPPWKQIGARPTREITGEDE